MTDPYTPTPRHDGWSPTRQRDFLEHLAVSGLVRDACVAVGISREAAYRLRQRREGAAFALGWEAALLLARWQLADTLMERAIDGQTDIVERDPDAHRRTHYRHDNRLALSVLGRLDRFADGDAASAGDARLIAGDWEAFLDLISGGRDGDSGGAAAALFLAARRPVAAVDETAPGPCQLCGSDDCSGDDDDDDDDDEYAASLARMRPVAKFGAGFIEEGGSCGNEIDEGGMRRWLSVFVVDHKWMTNFPPPTGFEGNEEGIFGLHDDYRRVLTDAELHFVEMRQAARIAREMIIARRIHAEVFVPDDEPHVALCATTDARRQTIAALQRVPTLPH